MNNIYYIATYIPYLCTNVYRTRSNYSDSLISRTQNYNNLFRSITTGHDNECIIYHFNYSDTVFSRSTRLRREHDITLVVPALSSNCELVVSDNGSVVLGIEHVHLLLFRRASRASLRPLSRHKWAREWPRYTSVTGSCNGESGDTGLLLHSFPRGLGLSNYLGHLTE